MGARKARHRRGVVVIAFAIAAVAVLLPALAFAHIERASYWPDPAPDTSVKPAAGGSVPAVRKHLQRARQEEAGQDASRLRRQMPSKKLQQARHHQAALEEQVDQGPEQGPEAGAEEGLQAPRVAAGDQDQEEEGQEAPRDFNIKLLRQCKYKSIQDAVTASHNNDRVEIMPGLYTEPKSRAKPTNDPACAQYKITNDKNQAGAVSYAYQWHCPNDQNLIAVLGRALTNTPVPQPPRLDRHVIPDAGAVHPLQPADPGHRRLP